MNKDNAKDYLPLVQALAEGKKLEYLNDSDEWEQTENIVFQLFATKRSLITTKYQTYLMGL